MTTTKASELQAALRDASFHTIIEGNMQGHAIVFSKRENMDAAFDALNDHTHALLADNPSPKTKQP